jgi:hypothetical protein
MTVFVPLPDFTPEEFLENLKGAPTVFGANGLWHSQVLDVHRFLVGPLSVITPPLPESSKAWLDKAVSHVVPGDLFPHLPPVWTEGQNLFVRQDFLEQNLGSSLDDLIDILVDRIRFVVGRAVGGEVDMAPEELESRLLSAGLGAAVERIKAGPGKKSGLRDHALTRPPRFEAVEYFGLFKGHYHPPVERLLELAAQIIDRKNRDCSGVRQLSLIPEILSRCPFPALLGSGFSPDERFAGPLGDTSLFVPFLKALCPEPDAVKKAFAPRDIELKTCLLIEQLEEFGMDFSTGEAARDLAFVLSWLPIERTGKKHRMGEFLLLKDRFLTHLGESQPSRARFFAEGFDPALPRPHFHYSSPGFMERLEVLLDEGHFDTAGLSLEDESVVLEMLERVPLEQARSQVTIAQQRRLEAMGESMPVNPLVSRRRM